MKGPTHRLIGTSLAGVAALATGSSIFVAVGLVGVAYKTSKGPDQLEGGILPHRGPTHRVWAVAVAAGAAALAVAFAWPRVMRLAWPGDADPSWLVGFGPTAALVVASGVVLGYGGHLAADACTRGGLRVAGRKVWLLPRPLRIKVGSWAEALLFLAIVMAWAAYVWVVYA